MSFSGKKFRSRRQLLAYEASLAGRYKKALGSFWLSSFTAIKYEQGDRKVQEINEEDILKMKKNQREFDIKEEYYRLQGLSEEDWEPVRVARLKDESENVW